MLHLRIGLFLALRQLQKASLWTSLLIVTVITFTFLNLVVVSGILLGIVAGAVSDTRNQHVGDVILSPLPDQSRIERTELITQTLATFPEVASYSSRLQAFASIEANYKDRQLNLDPDIIPVTLTGINPEHEANTVNVRSLITEGEYFDPDESGYIILGKYAIDRYAEEFGNVFPSLENVYPGTTVRVTANGESEEFIVKGIMTSKIDLVSLTMYLPEREFRRLFGRAEQDASEIIIKTAPGYTDDQLKAAVAASVIADYAEIETFDEAKPKFVTDVADTFTKLSLFVGAIGLVVASITIFIVIFINALSRRRQIGILKAIGISRRSIIYAYTIQALCYALIGSLIGIIVTFYVLIPYFIASPIDFPYSDVSLSLSGLDVFGRAAALLVVTLIAGFLPAWMIVRQHTLNSILGKK